MAFFQDIAENDAAVHHVDLHVFYHHDLGVHLDPAGGCLVQLGGKDRVQKWIAGADKLTGERVWSSSWSRILEV